MSNSYKCCRFSYYTLFVILCLLFIIMYLYYSISILYVKNSNIVNINHNNNNISDDITNIAQSNHIKALLITHPTILPQLCSYNYLDLSYMIWSHRAYLSNMTIDGSYNVVDKLL